MYTALTSTANLTTDAAPACRRSTRRRLVRPITALAIALSTAACVAASDADSDGVADNDAGFADAATVMFDRSEVLPPVEASTTDLDWNAPTGGAAPATVNGG